MKGGGIYLSFPFCHGHAPPPRTIPDFGKHGPNRWLFYWRARERKPAQIEVEFSTKSLLRIKGPAAVIET